MANISHFTQTVNGVSTTYDIHDANAVPRSGGAVMTGSSLGRTVNSDTLRICGGDTWGNGATISLYGKDAASSFGAGTFLITPTNNAQEKYMSIKPDGTWTWDGTACQITSDQRLKQQIAEIDDKLLDAWESVELCQFKYNDAVEEKGTKA